MTVPAYESELDLLSSIMSKNIEKIIITRSNAPWNKHPHLVGNDFWESLRNTLTELPKKSGLGNKLELELRGEWDDVLRKGVGDIWKYYLQSVCRRLTVWDVQGDLICSSDDGFRARR